ncbi:MAG: TolB family protein [Bacillota bacterium]
MFGLNLPAKGFFLIVGVVLMFFIVGCAEQVPAEEERGAEAPVEDEEAPDESAEGLSDQVYFSKEKPHYRTEAPLVSPDQNYLLGTLEGQLMLYEYPEKELLNSFDFDQAYTLKYYTWHPRGEAFVVFVESDLELHIYLVDLDGEQKKIKTFDQAAFDTDVISLEELDVRVDFLDFAFRGEAMALDIHREEYSSVKLIDLDGQSLLAEDWDGRSFLRRPLADPEGRQIAFTRYGLRGENLWIWDLDDEEIRRVTDGSQGDYPFYWLDQKNLVVILGAIGTGGGYHYGLAQVNLETGEREWEYSLDQERKTYVASSLSPDHSLVLGMTRNMAGIDARASILDLETREQSYFLDDHSISQSEWISDDTVLFSTRGWKREEERYSGPEDHYTIKLYSLEDGLRTLIEDDEQLFLLGVTGGELHYLKTADDPTLWVWQTKELELE